MIIFFLQTLYFVQAHFLLQVDLSHIFISFFLYKIAFPTSFN
jgi:hypothetical protein